jgi:glycosyltransferase involved in cell wall biosynthesis
MAARCPVVVASTGGLTEVVALHETGLTVHPNDAGSLAWGILHTLQHREWSRTRAENAYQVVCEDFNWARIARQTADVYTRAYAAWEQDNWGKALVPQAS